MKETIIIKECDFSDARQRQAIIDLMNHYMADRMGGNLSPYSKETSDKVVNGLQQHPSRLVLLAQYNNKYVGLANCFINLATFTGRPFINIHDIVVLDRYRSSGIGRVLMEAIGKKANELGCSKITLEVREDNQAALALYRSMGYDECKPVMHFWTKYL